MCSRQGEDENLDEPIRKLKLQNDGSVRLCVKCQENEAKFVIRQNDPFCRDCFLTHVTHKFRSNIGKSKLIRDRDCILLAYSGGPSSSALLHLVKDGLELSKFKKLRFIPEIVYIDEGAALGQSWAQRQEILIQIKEFCERMGMPYYITSLEQVFCPPENSKIKLKLYKNGQGELLQDTELEEKLVNLIRNTKSSTFKEQLIRHLRNDLLDRIARLTGNKMIMVGTGENRLAILMLADIAQGRGAHISLNVGFSDDRNDDILTVRPLKNLTSKEVAMYNNTNNITPVVCYSLTTMGSCNASIERLTEKFVTELHVEYPSTVCNITRTSEKLDVQRNNEVRSKCTLCKGWLDTAVLEASALNALHLSYNLSNGIQEQQVNGEGNCNSNDVGISDHLCFGCRAMAREMNEPDLLPIQMTQPNISLLQKDYIKDFLLEPSNENILNTGDS
ncbi:tRNA 2-thiolation 2-A-like [Octopus vulgaris]|uniref:Cytoplasmic tRNA 2-thiolation protein 2 n=1 Tax=Octopus vulgaris TaxID=6645 RepID=A0AA36BNA0_OCTVU|nr:tRNA 2-thiolation 2-A-like [Octopus vulgaris]